MFCIRGNCIIFCNRMSYLIRGFPQPIGVLSTPACFPRFVARLNMDPSGALGSTGSLAPLATPKIMCIYICSIFCIQRTYIICIYISISICAVIHGRLVPAGIERLNWCETSSRNWWGQMRPAFCSAAFTLKDHTTSHCHHGEHLRLVNFPLTFSTPAKNHGSARGLTQTWDHRIGVLINGSTRTLILFA